MSSYYAQLKPYDPKRDNAMKVFVIGNRRFDAGAWVPVDAALAAMLQQVHQSYYDMLSPAAFEVRTADESLAQGAMTEGPTREHTPDVKDEVVPEVLGDDIGVDASVEPRPVRGRKIREG